MIVALREQLSRGVASFSHGFDLLTVPRPERERGLPLDARANFIDCADRQRVAVELDDVMVPNQRRDRQQSLPRAAPRAGAAAKLGTIEEGQPRNVLVQRGAIVGGQASVVEDVHGAGLYLPRERLDSEHEQQNVLVLQLA